MSSMKFTVSVLARFVIRFPQNLLIGVVKGYRLLLSPWLGSACRFAPTCSVYSLQALQQHGAKLASALDAAGSRLEGLTIHRES